MSLDELARQARWDVPRLPACGLDEPVRLGSEAAVVLALAYGMRRGEVLGLHWSALDWKAGTLRVTHGIRRVKDRDASSDRRTRLVVTEPGSVRRLICARGSQRGSQSDKKARCRAGNGPVTWARSEGLEPPTF